MLGISMSKKLILLEGFARVRLQWDLYSHQIVMQRRGIGRVNTKKVLNGYKILSWSCSLGPKDYAKAFAVGMNHSVFALWGVSYIFFQSGRCVPYVSMELHSPSSRKANCRDRAQLRSVCYQIWNNSCINTSTQQESRAGLLELACRINQSKSEW